MPAGNFTDQLHRGRLSHQRPEFPDAGHQRRAGAASAEDESEDGTRTIYAVTSGIAKDAMDNLSSSKARIIYASYTRHLEGGNYVFADGHAKWMKIEQTLNPTNFLWGKRVYFAGNAPIPTDGSTSVR